MGNSRLKIAGLYELFLFFIGRRKRYQVTGKSMLPCLAPDDVVLAKAVASSSQLNIQDIVVFFDKERGLPMIKRVKAVNDTAIEVVGDNTEESAIVAPVPAEELLGVVTSISKP